VDGLRQKARKKTLPVFGKSRLLLPLMSLYNPVHISFYVFLILLHVYQARRTGLVALKGRESNKWLFFLFFLFLQRKGGKKKSYLFNHVLPVINLYGVETGLGRAGMLRGGLGYEAFAAKTESHFRCPCFPFFLLSTYIGVSSHWIWVRQGVCLSLSICRRLVLALGTVYFTPTFPLFEWPRQTQLRHRLCGKHTSTHRDTHHHFRG